MKVQRGFNFITSALWGKALRERGVESLQDLAGLTPQQIADIASSIQPRWDYNASGVAFQSEVSPERLAGWVEEARYALENPRSPSLGDVRRGQRSAAIIERGINKIDKVNRRFGISLPPSGLLPDQVTAPTPLPQMPPPVSMNLTNGLRRLDVLQQSIKANQPQPVSSLPGSVLPRSFDWEGNDHLRDLFSQAAGSVEVERSPFVPQPAPAQPDPNRPPRGGRNVNFDDLHASIFQTIGAINEDVTAKNRAARKKLGKDAPQEPLSKAEWMPDALGKWVLRITQGVGPDRSYQSDLHFDYQTGAIGISSTQNPGGAFFLTERITNLAPLMGRQYANADAFVEAAQTAGVYESKGDFILRMLQSKNNLLSAAWKLSQGNGDSDESSYESMMPNELSGHARVRWANAITLPKTVQEEGDKSPRRLSARDWANFLEQSKLSQSFIIRPGTTRMLPIGIYESQSWPQDAEGKVDVNKVIKRDQQRGNRNNKPLYSEPNNDSAMPRVSLPYRYSGQIAPHEGYKQRALFLMHNVVTPEGQAWIRENAGYFKTGFARVVNLSEEELTAAGIVPGATFDRDQLRRLGQILGRNLQSYESAAIDRVEKQKGGGFLIAGGGFKGLSGVSNKLMQKAALAVTPHTSGIIPKGHHMVMAMSGAGDLMGIGERALGMRYNDTNDFMRVMRSYAVGYNNLGDEDKKWVDENADWIKTAKYAGRYSPNQETVKNLEDERGVIGGRNAPIFSTMIRDYALSQIKVHELKDQIIDASTYEMHKDMQIEGRPMLEDVVRLSGEGDSAIYKIGTYRDYGISADVLSQFQPEFERDKATISGETLDKLARYNPGMFDYLNTLEAMGAIRNPARDIVTAVRANYVGETGEQAREALNRDGVLPIMAQRSIQNISAFNGMDLGEIYSAVRESMPEAAEGLIDEEFLRRASDVFGNHALQVGSLVLPSVQAALSTFTLDSDENSVSTMGSMMARMLLAHTNMNDALNLGDAEAANAYADQRFDLAYRVLQAGQELMNGRDGSRPDRMIDKVSGMTMPVIAGSAIGSKLLKPNEISVSMAKLFEMTHARTEAEQAAVLKRARSGELTAMVQMFPEANSRAMVIQTRIRLNEDINAEYGDASLPPAQALTARDWLLSNENVMHMSEQIAFALTKDFDRDTMRTILSGMYVGEGQNRQWIGADAPAYSAAQVRKIAESSVGAETVKQQERAAQTLASYTKEVWDKYKPQSEAEIGKSYEDFLRAKFEMGPAYNFGIRGITRFTEILMDRAGITTDKIGGVTDEERANVDRIQEAISGFSQYAYQTAIDFNVNTDPNVQRIQGMFKTLNWDSKKTGNALSYYVDPVTNKAVEIKGSELKSGLASEVMKAYASIGLHSAGLENMPSGERAAELEARAENYKRYMAPHLSVMMLPLNASEQQRGEALNYLNEVADRFADTGKFEFDSGAFAKIAGKRNALHWFTGSEHDKLSDVVPAAAVMAARAGLRVDQKNPDKAGTKMGKMPFYQDILQQVDASIEAGRSESVEEFLNRVPLQAPEVTPYTQKAMRRAGGSGSEINQTIRRYGSKDEIAQVADQQIAPFETYQEKGKLDPVEQGRFGLGIPSFPAPVQPAAQQMAQVAQTASQVAPQVAQVAAPMSAKGAEQLAKRKEMQQVIADHPDYSVRQIAQAIGRSPSWVRAWKNVPIDDPAQQAAQTAAPQSVVQQADDIAAQIAQEANPRLAAVYQAISQNPQANRWQIGKMLNESPDAIEALLVRAQNPPQFVQQSAAWTSDVQSRRYANAIYKELREHPSPPPSADEVNQLLQLAEDAYNQNQALDDASLAQGGSQPAPVAATVPTATPEVATSQPTTNDADYLKNFRNQQVESFNLPIPGVAKDDRHVISQIAQDAINKATGAPPNKPPSPPVTTGAPNEPEGSNGSASTSVHISTSITHPIRFLATLTDYDVEEAADMMRAMSKNSQRVTELGLAAAQGQDLSGDLGEIKNYINRYRKVASVSKKLENIRASGRFSDRTMRLAEELGFFEPDSPMAIDPFLHQWKESINPLRLAAMGIQERDRAMVQSRFTRLSEPMNEDTMTGAGVAMDRLQGLRKTLGDLAQVTENFTKVQKDHLATIQGLHKAYTDVTKVEEDLSKRVKYGQPTDEEKRLLQRIQDWKASSGADVEQLSSVFAQSRYGLISAEKNRAELSASRIGKGMGGLDVLRLLNEPQTVAQESADGTMTDVTKPGIQAAIDDWDATGDRHALYTLQVANKAFLAAEGGNTKLETLGADMPRLAAQISQIVTAADALGIKAIKPVDEAESGKVDASATYLARYDSENAVEDIFARSLGGDNNAFFHLQRIVKASNALLDTAPEAIPEAFAKYLPGIRRHVAEGEAAKREAISDYKLNDKGEAPSDMAIGKAASGYWYLKNLADRGGHALSEPVTGVVVDSEGGWSFQDVTPRSPVHLAAMQTALESWETKRDPRALYTIKRAQKAMQALEGGKGAVHGIETLFGDDTSDWVRRIGAAVNDADLAGIKEQEPLTEREAAESFANAAYLQRYKDPTAITGMLDRFAKGDANAFYHLKRMVSSVDALEKTSSDGSIPSALKDEMFNIRMQVAHGTASGMEATDDYKAAQQYAKRVEAFQFDPKQIQETAIQLSAFAASLKDVQQITKGAAEENRAYLKVAQNQIKLYDDLTQQLEVLNKKAEQFDQALPGQKQDFALTKEEQNLREKLKQTLTPELGESVGQLRQTLMEKRADAMFSLRSDDEHQQYMLEALFTGGKQGRKLREQLTDADYERGVDLPILGQSTDRRTIEGFGAAGRVFQSAMSPFHMFMVRHGAQMIQQEFDRAQRYDETRYVEGMMLARSGYMNAADFTSGSGVYGQFMSRRANRFTLDRAMGRAASDALSPILNASSDVTGAMAGLAPAAVAGSIGLGAGMIGAGLGAIGTAAGVLGAGAAFAIGAPLALGAAAFSLAGTTSANANNWYAQARSQQGQFDLGGLLGRVGNGIGGLLGGDLKYRTQSAASGAVLNMIQSGMTTQEILGSSFDSMLWGQTTRYNVSQLYSPETIKGEQFQYWKNGALGSGLDENTVNNIYGAMSFMDASLLRTGVVNPVMDSQMQSLAKQGVAPDQVTSGALLMAAGDNVGITDAEGLRKSSLLYTSLLNNSNFPKGFGVQLPGNFALRNTLLDAAMNLRAQQNPQRAAYGVPTLKLEDVLSRFSNPVIAYTQSVNDSWQTAYMALPGSTLTGPLGTAMQSAANAGNGQTIAALMAQQDMGVYASRYSLRTNTAYDKNVFENLSTTLANNPALAAQGENLSTPLATLLSSASDPGSILKDPSRIEKVAESAAELLARNINPNDVVSIRMARAGRSDTARNRQLYTDDLFDQLENGLNPDRVDLEKATGELEIGIAGLGRLAGRGDLSLTNDQRAYFANHVEAGSIYSSIQNAASNVAIAGDGFYNANAGRYSAIANLTYTDPAAAARQNQQMAQSATLYQNRLGTLVNPSQAASFLGQAATQLAPKEYSQVVEALNNNQVAWSQMAASGVLGSQFATIDLQTGADAFRYGINATEYGNIQRYAAEHGLTDMLGSPQMLAGGTRGMEMEIRNKSIEMNRMQFATQMAGIQIERMFTNGGVTTLDAQGFSTGGQVSSRVQGYQINPGNGMTGWQIEDAMTRMNREKQAYSMAQQGQSLNLQQAQFDLASKQFYEKFALSQSQFEYNTGYQRTEMGIQRGQSLRQRQWQAQDLAFQRDQSEVGFGWEQEDFDRNIRYARGRERLDLIRQKNRSVISHSMQMGQMDRQEERFKEGNKWEDERYEREKKRFEKSVEYQRDEMAMQKRHFEEGRAFDKQRMDMQKDSYEKELGWIKQSITLEDQKRLLDRQHYTIQQDMQVKLAGAMFAAQEQVRKLNESIQLSNEAMAAFVAKNSLAMQTLNGVTVRFSTLLGILQNMASITPTLPNNGQQGKAGFGTGMFANADGGYMDADYMRYWRGQQPRSFSDGGYTGIGGKYEPAGIVHRGEYVVPQQGAVAIRGDNSQTTELLKKVVQVLERIEGQGPGRVNATIYTNQAQVKTADLTAKDRVYARLKQ